MSQRFEFLDGLRGIAALAVVLFHLNIAIAHHAPQALPFALDYFLSFGYLGIQIFFVLSGFVIAYSLRNVEVDGSFLGRFFLKRSLRLDPSYWAVIALTLLLAFLAKLTFKSAQEFPFSLTQIFYNWVYIPDLMQVPLIIPVAWTLCIEFQFYLFFVVMLMFIPKKHLGSRLGLIIWTSILLFSVLQNTPLAVLPLKPVTFIPHWYSFFLGCLICWAFLGIVNNKFLIFNVTIVSICSLWTKTPHAVTSVGVALLIYLVGITGYFHQLLRQSFFQYTGKISYTLYLIHWPVGMKLVDFAAKQAGPYLKYDPIALIVLMTSLLLTLAVADLFYRLIEGPSHQWSRGLFSKDKNVSKELQQPS